MDPFDDYGDPTYRGSVYPWHCDHMGHMNVMWYVGKFDEATWNLFAAAGMTPAYFTGNKTGMAAVQQNIAYERELLAGDVVAITTEVREARGKVVRFAHRMYNAATRERAAICELTAVHLDRVKRQAVPFPDEIRKRPEARRPDSAG